MIRALGQRAPPLPGRSPLPPRSRPSQGLDGRLFRKLLALDIDGEHAEFFVGATVVTQIVQTVHDMLLAERFLSHIRAVEEAALIAAVKRLEDFVRAGQRFPEQLQSARSAGDKPRIKMERFEMAPDKPVSVPIQTLNPHAVLTQPPLRLGPGGYVFRGFAVYVDISTEITRTGDDGSKAVIRWDVAKAADGGDASNTTEIVTPQGSTEGGKTVAEEEGKAGAPTSE